jgi:hypothetical protein
VVENLASAPAEVLVFELKANLVTETSRRPVKTGRLRQGDLSARLVWPKASVEPTGRNERHLCSAAEHRLPARAVTGSGSE